MDSDLRILTECFIDTILAEKLAFPKRGYKHIKGCNNIFLEMSEKMNNEAAFAIIDDDKQKSLLFKPFKLLKKHNENLAVYKHEKDIPHYVVTINKAAEDFILKNANKCGISLMDYNLPNNLPDLIIRTKQIAVKNDPDFKRLFDALKQNETSDFYKLAQWIELFKADPFNFNHEML